MAVQNKDTSAKQVMHLIFCIILLASLQAISAEKNYG